MLYEVSMWLIIGFLRSWSCLYFAVAVHRFPLVLILPLLGCGCAQVPPVSVLPYLDCGCAKASLDLGLVSSVALVVLMVSPVFFLPLLGCSYAQASPSLVLPLVICG